MRRAARGTDEFRPRQRRNKRRVVTEQLLIVVIFVTDE